MKRYLMNSVALVRAIAFENVSEMLETVTIETENGPVRINKTDYNPDTMTLVSGEAAPDASEPAAPVDMPATDPAAPVIPAPDTNASNPPPSYMVDKTGRGATARYFVIDAHGERVTVTGIDPAGYASEADAWAAIMALSAA